MKIKICGIQTVEAARWAAEAGADMIGFVFAPSTRKVDINTAKSMAEAVRGKVECVGVFVNAPAEDVEHVHQTVGLDYVQLHGDESRAYTAGLKMPVIKAFSIGSMPIAEMFRYDARHILIDSPPAEYRGGSGRRFDWSALEDKALDHSRLVLAGGINAGNIREAKHLVAPAAVDVSSGVEAHGVKDKDKIFELIRTMKGGEESGKNLYSARC